MPDQEVAEALRILRRNGIVPKASTTNFQMFSYVDRGFGGEGSVNTYIDLNKVWRFERCGENTAVWISNKIENKDRLVLPCSLEDFKKLIGVSDA